MDTTHILDISDKILSRCISTIYALKPQEEDYCIVSATDKIIKFETKAIHSHIFYRKPIEDITYHMIRKNCGQALLQILGPETQSKITLFIMPSCAKYLGIVEITKLIKSWKGTSKVNDKVVTTYTTIFDRS